MREREGRGIHPGALYAYVWEFVVPSERRAVFEATYGPDGRWVELFRRAGGYVASELFADEADATRYVTIDYWVSREAFEEFRRTFAREYDALDRECERFTSCERKLGDFRAQAVS